MPACRVYLEYIDHDITTSLLFGLELASHGVEPMVWGYKPSLDSHFPEGEDLVFHFNLIYLQLVRMLGAVLAISFNTIIILHESFEETIIMLTLLH